MTLILLFILLPAAELALLIEIGSRIGTMETLALIVITGVVGASLARHQGLYVLRQVQQEAAAGRIPGDALLDGLIILLAGALLITPGVLTDLVGFLALVPLTRRLVKILLWRSIEKHVKAGRVHVVHGFGPPPGGPVYDVTPEEDDDRKGESSPRIGGQRRHEP